MKFDQGFIDKVRESSNIVDIIGQYTQLKTSSADQHLGLCPYPDHNEKTPSFSVSDSKQVYYCFGCKKTGNVFTFLRDIMGLSFPEAIEYLARRASIDLPKQPASQHQIQKQEKDKKEKELLKRINALASRVFVKNLQTQPEGSMVRDYIQSRGFSPEIIETFKIGYALPEWEHLAGTFKSKSVPMGSAEKLGLIKTSKNVEKSKTGFFDIMRGRLIFPIESPTGEVIGFGGRVVDPEDKPKYLNSPESPLFHKGKTFYGLYETAKFIRSADYSIVVEGYTDLIALYAAGIKNVVATLGTALTEDHAKLLKRYSKNVVVLFDGDQAGRVAAERSLPLLLKAGLYPKGFVLPEGNDPDDFLKEHGVKVLKEKLAKSPDLFQVVMSWHFKGFTGSATEKVTIVDKLAPYLAQASDRRLKSLYIRELQDRLGVDQKWLTQSLGAAGGFQADSGVAPKSHQNPVQKGNNYSPLEVVKIVNPPKAELYLLNLALKSPENLEAIKNSGVLEQFSHTKIAGLIIETHEKYLQNLNEFDNLTASLVDRVEPPEILNLQFQKQIADLKAGEERKLIDDCIRRVKQEALKRKSKELAYAIASAPTEREQKLEELRDLQKSKLIDFKDMNQE
mgnify:CR=1 FL=1